MNERKIQDALFAWLAFEKGYLLSCPNYTPADWFENDMFGVTKAGFVVEFEIKISVSDFRADVKKGPSEREKQIARFSSRPFDPRSKHDRLADRDPKGPSRFYYVVPEGLVSIDQAPEWAGLIWINHRGRPHVKKEAPRLHRVKAAPKVIEHCRSVFYHRFWNLRRTATETKP